MPRLPGSSLSINSTFCGLSQQINSSSLHSAVLLGHIATLAGEWWTKMERNYVHCHNMIICLPDYYYYYILQGRPLGEFCGHIIRFLQMQHFPPPGSVSFGVPKESLHEKIKSRPNIRFQTNSLGDHPLPQSPSGLPHHPHPSTT